MQLNYSSKWALMKARMMTTSKISLMVSHTSRTMITLKPFLLTCTDNNVCLGDQLDEDEEFEIANQGMNEQVKSQ